MTAPFLPDAPTVSSPGPGQPGRSANTTPSPAADHSRTADTSAASPTFSIVIATYNYGHLIERAIQSVLHQTHAPHEIIVVDDGSTDDTAERMRRYADRVRYVRKENEGQSSAYNLGALTASADFVYILDAETSSAPTRCPGSRTRSSRLDARDVPTEFSTAATNRSASMGNAGSGNPCRRHPIRSNA